MINIQYKCFLFGIITFLIFDIMCCSGVFNTTVKLQDCISKIILRSGCRASD